MATPIVLSRREFGLFALCLPVVAVLPAPAATVAVRIQGMKFSPATLQVSAGDTVTFTNADGVPHTATSDTGAFDTGRLTRGKSASLTLSATGSFACHCAVHPSMKGTITVV
jgi:plastocyanin